MGRRETAWAPLITACASIRFRICGGGLESRVLSETYGSRVGLAPDGKFMILRGKFGVPGRLPPSAMHEIVRCGETV